ncbi:hypothetical protein Dimus_010522 [Dionaea muscipula]
MELTGFGYFTPEKRIAENPKSGAGGDNFIVEDLLDFSNDDDGIIVAGDDGGPCAFDCSVVAGAGNSSSADSSTLCTVGGGGECCNSSSLSGNDHPQFVGSGGGGGDFGSRSVADTQFSNVDLCVPYDDLAELEWLSNFVDESFSSEDLQKIPLFSGVKAPPDEGSETRDFQHNCPVTSHNHTNTSTSPTILSSCSNHASPIFRRETPVPGKARSKRARSIPCNWSSRLQVLSPPPALAPTTTTTTTTQTSSTESNVALYVGPKLAASRPAPKRKFGGGGGSGSSDLTGEGRKCLHCATDKTPQWRTGPLGPKTLCNACGVRYKSGRLVPEYRPAASPTFVLTKHSNSHRKVMELRRQKELMQQQQFVEDHGNLMFDGSNNPDGYLIHQHIGPDFRKLI